MQEKFPLILLSTQPTRLTYSTRKVQWWSFSATMVFNTHELMAFNVTPRAASPNKPHGCNVQPLSSSRYFEVGDYRCLRHALRLPPQLRVAREFLVAGQALYSHVAVAGYSLLLGDKKLKCTGTPPSVARVLLQPFGVPQKSVSLEAVVSRCVQGSIACPVQPRA